MGDVFMASNAELTHEDVIRIEGQRFSYSKRRRRSSGIECLFRRSRSSDLDFVTDAVSPNDPDHRRLANGAR
jgi:hypothetical protein